MKLYDHPLSPYALKVRGLLYEKGIEFEKREIHSESDREELLRLNPRGEVPALFDEGVAIYDSKVIAEYLEDRYPSPALLPREPAARARCRALELIADTQIDAAVLAVSLFRIFRPEMATRFATAHEKSVAVLEGLYARLEPEVAGDYFLGELSRADVTLVPFVAMAAFMAAGPSAERTPRLAAWLARMNERASVQRLLQEAVAAYERSQSGADDLFTAERLHWRSDRIEHLLRLGLGDWLLEELAADRAFLPPVP